MGREHEFAELIVSRKMLESFPATRSAYRSRDSTPELDKTVDRLRKKIKWHIAHSLSKRQKEVIRLYMLGKKEREIAGILGIKQQVVNIYKWRAIKKLQKVLTAEVYVK
ncbi:hypothetical protein JYU19_01955 [bacterium AH-315-J21]|nr:hypothetical protein [bacterium AH-315-J21]